ncbi:DUF2752 domain-containing protein [Streptomyces sp. CB02923]|uniref:DUF2752 domain-containing protein n=1 Tax=Streptomyces sp. CB02923 TaxID=1718985 RepID=UPI000A6F3A6C|nr:DUF2752 domain-containing protein [Streptomyces sp. CB02923]
MPAPHPTRRRTLEAWSGALLFTALTVLVALHDPEAPGHYPSCPFRTLTGLSCPGCGTLRALHDLTRGDVAAALAHNALFVAALPPVLLSWLRAVRGRPPVLTSVRAGAAALAVLLLWGVLRNLF